MKKYYFYLVGLTIASAALLGGLVESVSARNGGAAFLTFAGLWLVGAMIRVYWSKVKPQLEAEPEKDISMDTEV